jgi:hypothetical protein
MFPRNSGIVRKLLFAALVAGSSVAVPAAARAQSISGERALLNPVETAPGASRFESAAAMDGERALLGKSQQTVVRGTSANQPGSPVSVDGARALLGERKI